MRLLELEVPDQLMEQIEWHAHDRNITPEEAAIELLYIGTNSE